MSLRRGLAAPNFAENPGDLVRLGIAAEEAGFDGFFLWDHVLFANDGRGPDIQDPWLVLALIAEHTERITIGTMITPLSRRRPSVLARQCTTLDRISNGRLVLGVGIGSPPRGDFELFGDESDDVVRAEMLDEGLDVLQGLWSGEPYSHSGEHYTVTDVRFTPTPVQRPRIPIWVGGTLPRRRPMLRASRWDGAVPITWSGGRLARPTAEQIRWVRDLCRQHRSVGAAAFELAVWAEVAQDRGGLAGELPAYLDAGATWWIETAKPEDGWYDGLVTRIHEGV
ncbi:LLM class flavin-dependent oxidoreductase [Nostocoides sp. Soil756]|uniref:LLM class flavin-dependent oxidoreductase n=1 Tax=Nostocoides sp. Soil756 TaxID=1736399 RepID=UPI000A5658F7|nr:LLM class flavin-dependent oxidoreductase [Tetrasphaera sp. Soil756]